MEIPSLYSSDTNKKLGEKEGRWRTEVPHRTMLLHRLQTVAVVTDITIHTVR
jgi:hypothetical protein